MNPIVEQEREHEIQSQNTIKLSNHLNPIWLLNPYLFKLLLLWLTCKPRERLTTLVVNQKNVT